MYRFQLLFLSLIMFCSCARKKEKVLIFIEDSQQPGYMLTHEVIPIKKNLERNGFEVRTASLSGEPINTDSVSIKPDFKLNDVDIRDYAGFILPCMASDTSISEAEIRFVRQIVDADKPIAAQVGAVQILARTGMLKGRKFCFPNEPDENPTIYPEFNGAIFFGNGVVKDGNIITSGTCPWMARMTGHPDGTTRLTQILIETIRSGH